MENWLKIQPVTHAAWVGPVWWAEVGHRKPPRGFTHHLLGGVYTVAAGQNVIRLEILFVWVGNHKWHPIWAKLYREMALKVAGECRVVLPVLHSKETSVVSFKQKSLARTNSCASWAMGQGQEVSWMFVSKASPETLEALLLHRAPAAHRLTCCTSSCLITSHLVYTYVFNSWMLWLLAFYMSSISTSGDGKRVKTSITRLRFTTTRFLSSTRPTRLVQCHKSKAVLKSRYFHKQKAPTNKRV